jgi:hypothetical protein
MDSVNMVLKVQFDYAAWARLILFIKPPGIRERCAR